MTKEKSSPTKTDGVSLAFFVMILLATFVRGAVLFPALGSFNADPDQYGALADNLYLYGTFGERDVPTAFRPPLYPASLAALTYLRAENDRPIAPEEERGQATANEPKSKRAQFFEERLALSRNASIAFFHWILGLATVVMVYAFARKCGLGAWPAGVAGLLVAFDPILLNQSRLVMTETLAAFFAIALLLASRAAVERRARSSALFAYLAVGVLYGLASLCRPAFLVFVALAFVAFLAIELRDKPASKEERDPNAAPRRAPFALRVARLLSFLLGCALVLAPWTIRNERVFKRPIVATTHGGYTLYLANNPSLYDHYLDDSPWSLWNPASFHDRYESERDEFLDLLGDSVGPTERELLLDEFAKRRGLETIRERPGVFGFACFIRAGELWRVLPQDVDANASASRAGERGEKRILNVGASKAKEIARKGTAVFYLVEFVLAFVGCVLLYRGYRRGGARTSASPYLWGFLLVASVQLPHLVYWTNMRMRAPLETFIPVLAAVSLTILQNRRKENV